MRTGIPVVYRMTQAEIDSGKADDISGVRIEIIDSSGIPTGKVYESGAVGEAPVQSGGGSSGASKKITLSGTGAVVLSHVIHAGAEVHTETGITSCTMAAADFKSSNAFVFGSFWLFNYTGITLPVTISGFSGGVSEDGDVSNDVAGIGTLVSIPHTMKALVVYDEDGWVRASILGSEVTQAELNLKVDKVTGKGLSTNDYTTAEQTKLSGIASGAEQNVQADFNQATTTSDDYIKNKPVNATTTIAGLMSSTDKTKIDGIASGAEVNVSPDWNASSGDAQILNKPTSMTPTTHTHVEGDVTSLTTDLAAKSPIASPTFTGTVSGITKAMVGLGSVDNTADTAKPVSTAHQTALDGKSATSHAHSGTYEPANTNIQTHISSTHPALSSTTPIMDGVAAVGTGTTSAKADHVHPKDTAKQDVLVSGLTHKTLNNQSMLGSGDIVITPTTVSSTVPTHNLDLVSDNYAGRALHLRPNGMTATANLALWSDSSGNGRDVTQATAGNQPDVVTNVLNGLPVVDFDGVDDYMDASSSLSLNASTIFTVIRPTVSAANKTILGATSPGPEWKIASLVPSIDLSGVGVLVSGTTALVAGQWTLLVFKKTGVAGTNGIYINGLADTMGTNLAYFIGAYIPRIAATHVANSSTCFDGDIAEIVVFPIALSDTERQKVEGYLAHKYALLANLDAGHPYKTTAPQAGSLQVFADQAAAIAGGLPVGQVYMTAIGTLNVRF